MDIFFQEPTSMSNDEVINSVRQEYSVPSFSQEMAARWGLSADYHYTWMLLKGAAQGDIDVPYEPMRWLKFEINTPETLVGWDIITQDHLDKMREKEAISKDRWLDKVGDRTGLIDKYEEGITEWKTDQLIKNYDERKYKEYILGMSPGTLSRELSGFAVMLGVQATDPVNYIPIFGWGKEVTLLGKSFNTLQRFVKAYPKFGAFTLGAMDAAAATALTDAYIIPRLQAEGADAPWSNLVWDTVFSAGLGGLMSLGSLAFNNVIAKRDKRTKDVKNWHEIESKMEAITRDDAHAKYKEAEMDYTIDDEIRMGEDVRTTYEDAADATTATGRRMDEEFRADNEEYLQDVTEEYLNAREREDLEFETYRDDIDAKTVEDRWNDLIGRRRANQLDESALKRLNDAELKLARMDRKASAMEELVMCGGDINCISNTLKKYTDDFSEAEIKEIIDRFEEIANKYGSGKKAETALNKIIARERLNMLRERHYTVMDIDGVDKIYDDITSRWKDFWKDRKVKIGNKVVKPILEMFEGGERPGLKVRDSIDSLRTSIKANVTRQFGKIIGEVDGLKKRLKRGVIESKQARLERETLERAIRREIDNPGSTGIADAAQVARAWRTVTQYLWKRARQAGIELGYVKGYVPRSYDHALISAAGREKFIEIAMGLIDKKKSFGDISDPYFEEILGKVWDDIVLGKTPDLTKVTDVNKRVALTHAKHRVFVFNNLEAEKLFMHLFGKESASMMDSFLTYIERMARDIAITERLGPDSKANLKIALAKFASDLRKEGYTKDALEALSPKALDRKGWGIGAAFDIAHGFADAPVGSKAHVAARALRTAANITFLPRSTITSFVDLAMAAQNFRHIGVGKGQQYKMVINELLTAIKNPKERKQMLELLGFSLDEFNTNIASRFTAGETIAGKTSTALGKIEHAFFQLNGLTFWTDLMRHISALGNSKWLGMNADLPYNALNKKTRALLDAYGITSKMWDVIRDKGKVTKGKHTFIVAEELPQKIAEKLMALYHTEASYAAVIPDARTRRYLTRGHEPGTFEGEASRGFAQFKSFPTAMTHKVLNRIFYDSFPDGFSLGGVGKEGVVSMTHLLASMYAVGYVSRVTKDMLDLRSPRDPFDVNTFVDVFVQSGVGGIYMDFIYAAAQNRSSTLLSTVLGPSFNLLWEGIGTGLAVPFGVADGTVKKDLARLGRFGLKHVPFINLYFGKAMLDYGLIFRLEEYYNPGAMRRKERFYKDTYGAEYYFPPTDYY